ncbi:hypothetical protein STSP2_01177 [Anaerohalosphaera lusitana]|uniref:Uncharacterized protein n=1 Tax=Anaerohalosphaera lusitana TaxID=1936003 RepID=A0A1U9NJB3_9BACT|nr:hypothetical protein STSP2_01177 [Anaerohalosphaera lusitana]
MRWSASRSDEYCSRDSTAEPCPCGAAKNCPVSDGSAGLPDTFSWSVSKLPRTPDAACVAEHIPRAFSDGHRKTPASAERRVFGYRSQAASWDGRYDSNFGPAEDEPPAVRTRRMIWSARLKRAGLRICESVFFRLEIGVVALFPCLCPPELDLLFMQDGPECFNADRRNDLFLDKIFTQFFQ